MEEIMTVKEIAEYLKLTTATIYKLARSGEIPAAKVASEWRFKKELIDDWLVFKSGCLPATRQVAKDSLPLT